MLTPDEAVRQLQKMLLPTDDENEREAANLANAARLPKLLRPVAYALLNRDADGAAFESDDFGNCLRRQNARYAELETWSAAQRVQLFKAFFPRLAEQIELGWQFLKTTPYTHGYARKAFRAPHHAEATFPKRRRWLENLMLLPGMYEKDQLTATWLAAWAPHLGAGGPVLQLEVGQLLAAVIDAGGPLADEVFDILAQSLRNEHEIGGMGRHITTALLLCSRPEAWELMERTLLAAQRQEGLRQAILETVDEAHPQAFRRMLRLIRDHDLARFSSVVRAADVWFGYAWDSGSVGTINAAIDKALLFLDDETARSRALEGKVAEVAFLGLWSIAFEDAYEAIPAAVKLMGHAKVEYRYVGVLHLAELGLPEARIARLPALDDPDLRVAWCALKGLTANDDSGTDSQKTGDDRFERLERLYERLPPKATDTKPLVWPWSVQRLDRQVLAGEMISVLGDRPPTRLARYLSALHPWHRKCVVELLAKQKKWDGLTRETLLDLAGDSGSDVREACFDALAEAQLQPGEHGRLEGYLTRKTSDLRLGAIGLLVKQADADALASAERLLSAKHPQQRLAGLELLRQLAEGDREPQSCRTRAEAYRSGRKELTQEEEGQLRGIEAAGSGRATLDDALGLMNPAERSPVVPPKKRKVSFITDAAVACLHELDELVTQHRETNVVFENRGHRFEGLLGTMTYGFPNPDRSTPSEQNRKPFPLREIWEKWSSGRGKKLRDADGLELIRAAVWASVRGEYRSAKGAKSSKDDSDQVSQFIQTLCGGQESVELRNRNIVEDILDWLLYLDPPADAVPALQDVLETAFALAPAELHENLVELAKAADEEAKGPGSEVDWREAELIGKWVTALKSMLAMPGSNATPHAWTRLWDLMHWCDQPVHDALRARPDLSDVLEAFIAGAATAADLYDQLLGPRYGGGYQSIQFRELRWLTALRNFREQEAYHQRSPEIRAIVNRCRERIVEVELARGEEPTLATLPALDLESVYGADTLLRVLTALGNQRLKAEASWNHTRRLGRAATLTHLAGITYPNPDDNPAEFASKLKAAVAEGHIPESRVLELAFHAPQWCRFIEAYLSWPGFTEGLYWFLAHMKYIGETGEQAAVGAGVTAEVDEGDNWNRPSAWDRLIGERTPLTAEERQQGAIDIAWFRTIYADLTPKRWEAMAQAARFAANAAQAKRAQLIADVLLGKASRRDLISGIRKKFLKENVRLLGLLPLAEGTKRTDDIAERYRVLQEYHRYAKKLSAMTKEGAQRAVEIGLQNLARTAGYPDPLRLEWAMEVESVKDLAKGAVTAQRDNVTVTLSLDESARPQLAVHRAGKELKSIPPEIKKKDKQIAALVERVAELKRQSSRMRQSLEAAMCRGDEIGAAELAQLCQHGLLAPLLSRLVFVGDGILGYPDKGGKALRNHLGKLEPIKKTEQLRIAHSHDLFATGEWDAWQHECFSAERVQPFKQVFRELYLVTKQEKSDTNQSRRYAGQQVNPTQANALWGQRGWSVKEGVWKVFHDVGITASVEFNYGISTPLEVEGLTIEAIHFQKRDLNGPLKMATVPPRLFSEVMRDMDLVVSVAHRGAVDPEASASTVEMRTKLLEETSQLLHLDNVRLKQNYALVAGKLAKYSVHLGSGTVHKLPGGALCIVPVHAQHRGRLFLPFADNDPKTAEVISKVLLLARDGEIQDPVILDQLRH